MNITWKITNLEWIENVNNLEKVVKNIHWWVQAEDVDGNMGYTWGNTQLDVSNLTEFTNFDALTEEIVLTWLFEVLEEMYFETGTPGRQLMEDQAVRMCGQQDPSRRRGTGLPW